MIEQNSYVMKNVSHFLSFLGTPTRVSKSESSCQQGLPFQKPSNVNGGFLRASGESLEHWKTTTIALEVEIGLLKGVISSGEVVYRITL